MKLGVSSTNHHYIPKYYLKGFCRPDGTFDVYDKKYRKFKKAPQSPTTAFFERNRNTIKFKGQRTDEIEKIYARLENDISQLFDLIRKDTNTDILLSSDGIYLLKLHIAIQFWRLPKCDNFANQYLKTRTLKEIDHLTSIVKPKLMTSQQVSELIQGDNGFRHYFRSFWLPLGTFNLTRSVPDTFKWSILDISKPSEWSNHLCSDFPFILNRPEDIFGFSGVFVFPLSNCRILVSKSISNTNSSFDPIFSTKLSILLFLQTNQYIATSNRDYLEKVIELSESYSGLNGIEQLRNDIFSYLL